MSIDTKDNTNERIVKTTEVMLSELMKSLPPVSSGVSMPKVQPPKNLQPAKEQTAP